MDFIGGMSMPRGHNKIYNVYDIYVRVSMRHLADMLPQIPLEFCFPGQKRGS